MLKLGENIRKLRREKELTQEELADIFSVSPQAISRWEKGTTYPDITMLPTIAGYFDVTLDDLMGMEEIKDRSRLDEVLKKHHENSVNGLVEENIALMREELKNFPNDYELMRYLANDLFLCEETANGQEISVEEHRANVQEAIEISERILAGCSDSYIRNDITHTICYCYEYMGENEKAIEYAEKLPDAWGSSTSLLNRLYKGEKKKLQLQWTVVVCSEMIHYALQALADLNYEDESISTAERIKILKKGLQIYDIIYDKDDYLFHSFQVSEFHRYIAAMNMLEGDHEDALYNLEQAAKYAIMTDTLPEKEQHSSMLINRITYDRLETSKNFTFTRCAELYKKMQWDRYDAIRDDARFKAILGKIRPYI